MQYRVSIVFSHDSFYKGSIPVARAFEALGCGVTLHQYRLLGTEAKNDLFNRPGEQIEVIDSESLHGFFDRTDSPGRIYYLNLPGEHLEMFRLRYSRYLETRSNSYSRALLVGGFNGLLSYRKLAGFYTRSFLDVIHLNARSDLYYFQHLLDSLGFEDRPHLVLTGIPILDWAKDSGIQRTSDIYLFIEQPNIPASRIERLYLIDRLCDLAKRYPERHVVIKPRVKKTESTFKHVDFHVEDLKRELSRFRSIPANLRVSYEDVTVLVPQARLVISICSTVLLEAACLGTSIAALSDFGVSERIGNSFFIGSNVLTTMDRIINGNISSLDQEFFQNEIYVEPSSAQRLAEEVLKVSASATMLSRLRVPISHRVRLRLSEFQERMGSGPSRVNVRNVVRTALSSRVIVRTMRYLYRKYVALRGEQ